MNHVIREKRNLSGPFLKTNNKRQFDDTSYIFLYRLLIKLASTFYKLYTETTYYIVLLQHHIIQCCRPKLHSVNRNPRVPYCSLVFRAQTRTTHHDENGAIFSYKKSGKKITETVANLNFRPKNRKRPSLSTSLYVFTDNFDGTAKSLKALITA